MTTRVGHSVKAMRRLIQMSGNRVFIFVEGRELDPDFYSRLCRTICVERGLAYQIIVADRIMGAGGGKPILLRLFEHLRRKRALIDRSGPNSKLVMFYLDKDTDDIFRKMRRSEHVVYTRYYCVENHLFCEGELLAGIATAGSVDLELVHRRIPNPILWRRNAAVQWRNWLVLCLVAQRLGLGGRASYSVNHDTVNEKVNSANLRICEADLQARSGLSAHQFNLMITWAQSRVDRSISAGEHERIFKGKWYVVFALYELKQIGLTDGPINERGAKDRLVGNLIATLRFDGPWAEHYKEPLRRTIGLL
jgi:hypothetical protein